MDFARILAQEYIHFKYWLWAIRPCRGRAVIMDFMYNLGLQRSPIVYSTIFPNKATP
jgi:hypothetical protein